MTLLEPQLTLLKQVTTTQNDDFVDEPTADDPNPEPRLTCVRDDDTPIANGDLLAIDSHAITCTAIDLSGNQAELTQTVIVDYDADALSAIGSYAETVPEDHSFLPSQAWLQSLPEICRPLYPYTESNPTSYLKISYLL